MCPVKAMEHAITQNDPNVVIAAGVAGQASEIFTYTVPRHTAIQIRPEDILAALLQSAPATPIADTDAFRLLVRDPNGLTQEVLAQGDYVRIQEFADRNEVLRLGLSKLIKSDYLIVLEVTSALVIITVADSTFMLTCLRYAEVL